MTPARSVASTACSAPAPCERERLFAEDVLAARGSGHDLIDVHRMRRRKHDGIEVRVRQQIFVALPEREPVLARKTPDIVGDGAGRSGDEADRLARTGNGFNQRLAPPSQAHNSRIDHQYLPPRGAANGVRNGRISIESARKSSECQRSRNGCNSRGRLLRRFIGDFNSPMTSHAAHRSVAGTSITRNAAVVHSIKGCLCGKNQPTLRIAVA